jgi:glycerol kinase
VTSILALDQGTTGSTALVIHQDGRVLGRGYREFTQHFPRPGWVEHDAEEIFRVSIAAMREALAASSGEKPAGLGITNQRETVVLWDRKALTPVAPAIVWQDRRTAERCRELPADLVRERTGLVPDAYFSATKLEWLLSNVPGARQRAEAGELAAGTVDSWLVWNLTAGRVHATDHTNASRTMLYDIGRRDWDDELLDLFGIPRAMLPEVRPSSGLFGETEPGLFGQAVPVAGIAGDQQAALFGQGCWLPGLAKNTYGTGAFLLLQTGEERVGARHGLLTTIACDPEGQPAYALEGAIFIAGAAVQWLRDGLGVITAAGETEALAASLDGNDDVYFVPALTGLGAPLWDPYARGTIVGLTRGSTRAHLARATLEAIAYQTRDVVVSMEESSGVRLEELRVDGGAVRNRWLMQFQADMLGVPVIVPTITETTALGSAYLAGLATDVWADRAELSERWEEQSRYEPQVGDDERARRYDRWLLARTSRY